MSSDVNENDSHLELVAQNPAEIVKIGRKLPRGRPFQKGNVMNPGGRPKLSAEEKAAKFDLIQACRDATPKALETLLHLAEHAKQDSVKMNAAAMIIDRAYGKPVQPTDNVTRIDPDASMTAEEAYKLMLSRKAA